MQKYLYNSKKCINFAAAFEIMTMQISDFFIDMNAVPAEGLSQHFDFGNDFWLLFENGLIPKGSISANVNLTPRNNFYELSIDVKGVVQIPCDRCLDDVDIRVERQDDFFVKLGDNDDYGEEIIYVSRSDAMLDIATLIYEAAALTVPLVVTHPDGQCNPEMLDILKKHEPKQENKVIDPRWEKLQTLNSKL